MSGARFTLAEDASAGDVLEVDETSGLLRRAGGAAAPYRALAERLLADLVADLRELGAGVKLDAAELLERITERRASDPPSFTCPRCSRTSYDPNDADAGYCGACRWWTGDPLLGAVEPPAERTTP